MEKKLFVLSVYEITECNRLKNQNKRCLTTNNHEQSKMSCSSHLASYVFSNSAMENCCNDNNNNMILNLLPETNQLRSKIDERQMSNNDTMDAAAISEIFD